MCRKRRIIKQCNLHILKKRSLPITSSLIRAFFRFSFFTHIFFSLHLLRIFSLFFCSKSFFATSLARKILRDPLQKIISPFSQILWYPLFLKVFFADFYSVFIISFCLEKIVIFGPLVLHFAQKLFRLPQRKTRFCFS